ncbi:hypothetical protein CMK12_16955 [Candidatus Poribacteria bacterium]|nr:hypothetical protein [Candidatus Poribacteria bacterium]
MNIATLAEKLHNTEYPINIPQDILDEAKANRLVILCGYSDDMMDFSGAISDEVDAMNGGTAIVYPGGLLGSRDDIDEDEAMEAWLKAKKQAVEIEALWCEEDDYSWTYRTTIPHATFDVIEGDEKYCRGIVFSLDDLQARNEEQ